VAGAIVGTGRLVHLLENVSWAARGPLDSDLVTTWRERFRAADAGWIGQV
jgi:aromatic ring-opening dioxygenase catalytic subunit (LigB family)